MGGGPAIRTAKFTGFSALSGFRNHLSTPPRAEQAVSRAARPVSGIASGPSNDILVNSKNGEIDAALLQTPSWVLDEWQFNKFFDSADPPPRVVFGKVPTIEDTKEAVSVLKDTLEKIYFSSSTASSCDNSPTVVRRFTLFKSPITHKSTTILKSLPVLDAFRFLKENPEIEDVVASLAADENVFDAIMGNKTVVDFLGSQKRSCAFLPNTDEITEEGFTGHGSGEELPESWKNWFSRHVNNVKLRMAKTADFIFKLRVAKMVSNLPEFFKNVYKSPADENSSGDNGKGGSDLPVFFKNVYKSPADENSSGDNGKGGSDYEKFVRSNIITLIILIITVVVLKRPVII